MIITMKLSHYGQILTWMSLHKIEQLPIIKTVRDLWRYPYISMAQLLPLLDQRPPNLRKTSIVSDQAHRKAIICSSLPLRK